MSIVQRVELPPNSGASVELEAGQLLHVHARTIVDLVAFDRHDLTHRFDQARTKANQNTIFVSVGDVLVSKNNVDMLRIEVDTFEGHHDLQYGTCSRSRWEWALREGIASRTYLRDDGEMTADDFPDHGCLENILAGLEGYGVAPVDVPSPLNLFQHMEIDGRTGAMRHTRVRPAERGQVSLRALIDVLVAVSACPDLLVGGEAVLLEVEDR